MADVEVTFTNEDGNRRLRKWDALEILKDWEGEAMLCPPNDTELESATWNGKDLFVDANCCGEVGLTPGMHTFEDLMKLIRVLRDFPLESIAEAGREGMCFSIDGGKVEYESNYRHVTGVIDPGYRSVKILSGGADVLGSGYFYPEGGDPLGVLRAVGEAAGALDRGIEAAREALGEYMV